MSSGTRGISSLFSTAPLDVWSRRKKTIELHALYLKTSYINKTHGKNILYSRKQFTVIFNNKMPTLGIISMVHSKS